MRIHCLQHVPFEGPDQIQAWADQRQYTITRTHLYKGEPLPDPDTFDLLLIMGGPMSANDDYRIPWMKPEKDFIGKVMLKRRKVLGICLGAQILASILGARVYSTGGREIGWFPIQLDPPNVRGTPLSVLDQETYAFHWHGDTFDLPEGATHLARSKACENQAFAYGPTIIGLQFHLEVSFAQIQRLIEACSEDLLTRGLYVQGAQEMLDIAPQLLAPLTPALYQFLDAFTATISIGGISNAAD